MTAGIDLDGVRAFREKVDFGRTATEYRLFRAGFPTAFFEALADRGIGRKGQRILDLGTGTGTVARGLALLGAEVTGLDPAADLIQEALRLDAEAHVSIAYCVARAEESNLPDAAFDVVTAGQCWHWFDRDRAAREALRLLKPGGRVVIAHFDWIPLPGTVVAVTEALIKRYNPSWTMGGGTGLYPQWLTDLATVGFENLQTFSFDVMAPYTHESWRGRVRASAGVKASLTPERVALFDGELASLLAVEFPDDPLEVHHRCWTLLARKPTM